MNAWAKGCWLAHIDIRWLWSIAFCAAILPAQLLARDAGSGNSAQMGFGSNRQTAVSTPKAGSIDLTNMLATGEFYAPSGTAPATSYDGGIVDFYGMAHATFSGSTVNITIDGIQNYSSTYTTGSLRIELWALQTPYSGGSITGYNTASIRTSQVSGLSDQLGPGNSFYNISLFLNYSPPGDPSYNQYSLFLEEYFSDPAACGTSDHYCIIAALNLQPTSGGGAPVCSPSANPASLPASGGTVTISANCTNTPTSYTWILNGSYVSSSANFAYTLPGSGSSSPQTYTFTVSASNATGTGNGSVSVQVAGSNPPPSNHVNAPSPNASPCVRSATTACLLNGRFRVEANWSPNSGTQGQPTSIIYFAGSRAETDNAAVLYFQSPAFFEIGVTLYNGCSYGGTPYTWVFIGGLTDWSWAMTITDTVHGTSKQYSNPYGSITQTTTDYTAFSCN